MSAADKERNANREREKGNEAYKAGSYKEAYDNYTRSINFLPTAAAYNNRAITAIKLSRFSDAVSDCNAALKLEPTNTKGLLRRAHAYKSLKQTADAIADLQKVLQLEPFNEAAKSELEAIQKELAKAKSDTTSGGSSQQGSGKGFRVPVQEVREPAGGGRGSGSSSSRDATPMHAPPPSGPAPPNLLSEELLPLPPRVQKLKEEGNTFFKAGRYADAETKYTAALTELEKAGKEHEPSIALLLSNRAACLLKNGDSQRCIEDCTRSLTLSPLSVKSILRRATAYDSLEKYPQAYNDYQLALKIDTTVDLAVTSSDRLARHLKDKYGDGWKAKLPHNPEADLAMAALKNSGTSQEGSKEAMYDRSRESGNAHTKKEEYSEALECYTTCVQLCPDVAVPYTNRAFCHLKLMNPKKAEEDCSKALSIEPSNVKALYRRAMARKALLQYSGCLFDLKAVLDLEPSNSMASNEYAAVKNLWENSLRESQRKAQPEEEAVTTTGPHRTSKNSPVIDVKRLGKNKSLDSTGPVDRLLSGLSSAGMEPALKPTKTTYFTQKEKQASNRNMTAIRSMEGTKVVVKEGELSSEEEEAGGGRRVEGGRGSSMAEGADKDASLNGGETPRPRVQKQDVGGAQEGGTRGLVHLQERPGLARSDSALEWIQRWNSLSWSAKSKAYADLLKQIPPDSLPKVISNKLDGIMLNKIVDAIRDELMIEGHDLLIVQILQNLAKVPRFDTVLMFLSKDNQTALQNTVQKLSTRLGLSVSEDGWKKLRDLYKLI